MEILPELDGADPDFAGTYVQAADSIAAARQILGATRWSEDISKPAPSWLIPGLLQSQALHIISAPKSCRKTWLGLSMMLAGIYNKPVLDMQPTRPFNSLYIGADSPRWDIRGQLRKLCLGLEVSPQFPTEATSFITGYGPKFTKPAHLKALQDLIIFNHIDALFVDVMLYVYDGLDENDNTEMGQLFQILKFFRDNLGCAVVLLHHHAKGEGIGARGAGTITQAAEHHFELHRRKEVVTLVREKLRGDEDDFWTSMPTTLERHNEGMILKPVKGSSVTEWIQAALSHGPKSRAELVDAGNSIDFSTRTIDRALATLRIANLITASDGTWRLT